MNDLAPRLRAVCDLDIAEVREYSGRHEYDGVIQDLSPDGVRTGGLCPVDVLVPADPRSNNLRVFVITKNATQVRWI